ncbi:MAG: hypothetical protein PHO06_02735 [Clostridia bacterium]|nr:hypothetical protein [Clostridia bacterium]
MLLRSVAEQNKPQGRANKQLLKDFEELLLTKSSDQTPSASGVCDWSLG